MQSIAFEVSFIVDGEVYDTVKTNGSSTIKMPTDPTKEGYTFDGWYWDKDSWEKPFTAGSLLDAPLTSNMSVYAKWKRIDASSCTHVDDNNDDKCDVCGEAYTNSSDLPAHTHSYTVQNTDFAYIASEADCENAAKYYYACSCGKKGTETFTSGSAIGHTEVIDAAIDPTCTITGLTEGKRCSVCKEVLVPQRTVMPLGHTEVVDAAVAPTCTATGLTEGKHCSICNHVIKAQTVVDALDHDLVNANGKAATCTEAGYTAYKDCSRCDYTEGYEVIPAQHAYGPVQSGVPATCLIAGYTDYKICSECRKMVGAETIEPLGHELHPVNAKTATCYTDGYSAHQKCSRCYYTKGKTVYPAGHTGTWVSDGNNEYIICTIESCGRKAVREKDAAVNFENGAIIDANGKLAITNVSAGATAGGNARDKFTLVDDTSNKVLKVVSSKANANATAAKITLNHTDADHSIATGGKYLVTEFDVKFDFNTGVNTSKVIFSLSLYDNNGNHIYNFNFHSYGQKVKTNGIQLDYVADGTTWLTFRAVTELATERNAAGIYVATTKLYYKHRDAEGAMTYLTSGTKTSTYTGHTGRTDAYVTKLEIGPNDHDYTYYLDNMSFVRTAYSSCIYSDCNHSITETVIPATATSEGVVKRRCTVNGCGYAVAEYIPVIADSHDMDNGVITKAPTCAEPGVKTYTCKNGCGYTTTEAIPTIAHNWTDATCTAPKTCSACGVTEGSALAHSMRNVAPKTATCTEAGYNLHQACRNCDYTENKTEYPALGHDVAEWQIVTSPTCSANGVKSGYCSRCEADVNGVLYAQDHKFTSVVPASDSRYEYATCGTCGHVEYREKVGTITFSSGHLKDSNAINYEVGSLKTGGVGNASTSVGSSSTVAGNAWIKYSITGNTSDKVLNIVFDASESANYNKSKIKVGFTDSIRENSKDKYLVFDTDIKIDYDPTGLDMTNPENWYCAVNFMLTDNRNNILPVVGLYVVQNELHATWNVNFGIPLDYENPDWFNFRIVFTIPEAMSNDGLYHGQVDVYARHKDSSEPWSLLVSNPYSKAYSFNTSEPDFFVEIYQDTNKMNIDNTVDLDNISFIATSTSPFASAICEHVMNGGVVTTQPSCTETGVKTCACTKGCGYTTTETVPALGHTLSDWTDTADGIHEERACANCNYTVSRVKGVITFDDGSITDGGKLVYSDNANVADNSDTTATSNNDYATISTAPAPKRDGDTALRIQTVLANYNHTYAPTITLPTTDGSAAGDVYTLDFDIYNNNSYYNGTRSILQINLGKAALTLNQYKNDIKFGNNGTVLGTWEEWITIRIVCVVTAGKADVEVFKKGADGNYTSVFTLAKEDASFAPDTALGVSFFTYTSGVDRDYYLDNISLARTTSIDECEHAMDNGVITKAPTCTEPGVKTYTCKNGCGYTTTETVPALGHTEVVDSAKAATCTETGLTEGKHCLVCGTQTIAQEVVPTTGHTFGEWVDAGDNNKRRECEICGYSEVKKATTDGDNLDDGGWV